MRRVKGSRRISLNDIEYRWRASGNDGYISIGIWPINNIGAYISSTVDYHTTIISNKDGSLSSKGDQIVVTNNLIRLIIEHAITSLGYNPCKSAQQLSLRSVDHLIDWAKIVIAGN